MAKSAKKLSVHVLLKHCKLLVYVKRGVDFGNGRPREVVFATIFFKNVEVSVIRLHSEVISNATEWRNKVLEGISL